MIGFRVLIKVNDAAIDDADASEGGVLCTKFSKIGKNAEYV